MKPAVATDWPVLSRPDGRHVGVVLVTEACDLDVEAGRGVETNRVLPHCAAPSACLPLD